MPVAGAMALFALIILAGRASPVSVPFPIPTPRYMAAPLAPLARLAPMSLKMPENADARSLLETFGLFPLLMSTITSRSRVSDSNNSSCASLFPGLPEVAYTRALGATSLDLVV
ncbi:hypothetical protein BGZ57DRAFT_898216 [Hyaloscypha finlandica]|nr:hypothetical protein BGZ57DRAFT_898216 [Hyaloscypha finlandica]